MRDVDIDPENAMRQAGMTADVYLSKAYDILKNEYDNWTVRDAIELAKIMAQDFHTTMISTKLQEIRDAISGINNERMD